MKFLVVYLPSNNEENPAIALEIVEDEAVFSISNANGQPVPESLMKKIEAVLKEAKRWQKSK